MRSVSAAALGLILTLGIIRGQVPADAYRVENVPTPNGIAPEISAVAFGRDGKLYAAFRRGYIYAMDPATSQWEKFAEGFQTPLGILPGKIGELFIAHLPELTRVVDEDGDGVADVYETVSDGWGMSGNYHEFIGGPVRDAQGNFYISLGLASGGAVHDVVHFPLHVDVPGRKPSPLRIRPAETTCREAPGGFPGPAPSGRHIPLSFVVTTLQSAPGRFCRSELALIHTVVRSLPPAPHAQPAVGPPFPRALGTARGSRPPPGSSMAGSCSGCS